MEWLEVNITDGVRNESIESLLLMAVLTQGIAREAALSELRHRRVLRREPGFKGLYMANFSVAAC